MQLVNHLYVRIDYCSFMLKKFQTIEIGLHMHSQSKIAKQTSGSLAELRKLYYNFVSQY